MSDNPKEVEMSDKPVEIQSMDQDKEGQEDTQMEQDKEGEKDSAIVEQKDENQSIQKMNEDAEKKDQESEITPVNKVDKSSLKLDDISLMAVSGDGDINLVWFKSVGNAELKSWVNTQKTDKVSILKNICERTLKSTEKTHIRSMLQKGEMDKFWRKWINKYDNHVLMCVRIAWELKSPTIEEKKLTFFNRDVKKFLERENEPYVFFMDITHGFNFGILYRQLPVCFLYTNTNLRLLT